MGRFLLPWLAVLGCAEARAGVVVVGELVQEFEISPGAEISGALELVADGSGWDGRVYLADYETSGERRAYPEAGTLARSIAPWTTVAPAEVRIAPEGRALVVYTIDVPDRIDLAGSYWAALMVEGRPEGPPPGSTAHVTIQSVHRVAVRVTVHIAGTGSPRLQILEEEVRTQDGTHTLVTEVRNVGERAARTGISVHLAGADGQPILAPGDSATLYPGCSYSFRTPLPGLQTGEYSGLIVADAGLDQAFGKRIALSYDLWGVPTEIR